jgi:excinuclease ABC subunit B
VDETQRRRRVQTDFNAAHGITPETIRKSVQEIEFSTRVADARSAPTLKVADAVASYQDEVNVEELVKALETEMASAAAELDFEKAAILRDELFDLKAKFS